MRVWDLDGGPGDRHRIMLDDKGELWGSENVVKPWEKKILLDGLESGATQWRWYSVQERSGDEQNG